VTPYFLKRDDYKNADAVAEVSHQVGIVTKVSQKPRAFSCRSAANVIDVL